MNLPSGVSAVYIIHKLKGDKITQKRKVWRKKKYGYGYVTISQVTYSCKGGMKPMNSETSIDSNEPNLSPVLTNEQGGSTTVMFSRVLIG